MERRREEPPQLMTLARPDKCLAGSIETSVLDNLLCNMPPKHISTANKLQAPN